VSQRSVTGDGGLRRVGEDQREVGATGTQQFEIGLTGLGDHGRAVQPRLVLHDPLRQQFGERQVEAAFLACRDPERALRAGVPGATAREGGQSGEQH
jgi:hypothetical protein